MTLLKFEMKGRSIYDFFFVVEKLCIVQFKCLYAILFYDVQLLKHHVKGKFYHKTIPVLYITFIFVTAFHLCYCGVLEHIVSFLEPYFLFLFYFQVSSLSYLTCIIRLHLISR